MSAASTQSNPLVELRQVTKAFAARDSVTGRRSELVAVDDVSFEVARGSVLGLVGESGSGKTTVGRIVAGLARPSSGSVCFDGEDLQGLSGKGLARFRKRVQVVFQNPHGSLNPALSIRSILWEGLRQHPDQEVRARGRRDSRLAALLELVQLDRGYLAKKPAELSGGQRQRVSIARALAMDPELVIADEPTSALDVSVQADILNLFIDLRERLGLTYVFISHDLGAVRYICDEVLVMQHGRLVERGPRDQVLGAPAMPYTRELLRSAEETSPRRMRQRPSDPGTATGRAR